MEDIRLGAILLEGGIVDESGLERCLAIQTLTGGARPIGQILVEQGLVDQRTLERLLELQRTRVAARKADVATVDAQCTSLLNAARANGADELVVSEGRTARIRVGCSWRELTGEVLRGPEVWDLVRETMGNAVLEELAERQFVVRQWHVPGVGRGSATAFRQVDGVAVRLMFTPDALPTAEHTGVPKQVLDVVGTGRGLLLVVGERGVGRAEMLSVLLHAASGDAGQYVVVVDDEAIDLPKQGALVVRRRFGVTPEERTTALHSVVREDPDVLVIADVGSAETFELALRAAESGRLVIGYMDATNSTSALVRALNFYPSYELPRIRSALAAALRAVLVRQVLPDVDHAGSVAATELLLVDDSVREVIRAGELGNLNLLIRAEGGRCGHSLDRNMLDLLVSGRVRMEDVFARAEEKAWLLERTRDLQPLQR